MLLVFSNIPSPQPRAYQVYIILTKKLTDEFFIVFTDMTYVPGQFFPYNVFATKPSAAIFQDGHFKRLWARYLISRWMNHI